jgi:hypothetical protein
MVRGEPRGVPVLAIQTYIAEGALLMNAEQWAAGVVRRDWHSLNVSDQRCDFLDLNLWLLELNRLYRINFISFGKFS